MIVTTSPLPTVQILLENAEAILLSEYLEHALARDLEFRNKNFIMNLLNSINSIIR